MRIKQFISLALLTAAPYVFSQDRAGNGGDAIICHMPDGATTVEVKDYWEYSQMINTFKIDLGPGATYQDKVIFVLNRLKKVDQKRAENLIQRFHDETFISFVSRGQIPVVNDSPSYLKVDGDKYCNEVQAAFQILNPKQFQSKVLIDKTIFMQLDEVNKAGLILHELIYEQDIKYNNAKDSDTIRWFNYIISSNILKIFDDLKNGKSQKYASLISDRKIDYFGYDSVANIRNAEETISPSQVVVTPPLSTLLPKNFSIVSSEQTKDDKNTAIESMTLDIEDESLQFNQLKLKVIKKHGLIYQMNQTRQTLSGSFSYSNEKQDWMVSDISTVNAVEYNLKLEEKSVTLQDIEFSGDLTYSINLLNQSTLSGVKTLRNGEVSLVCLSDCRVSLNEGKMTLIQGNFSYNGLSLQSLDTTSRGSTFILQRPLEYKTKTPKGSQNGYIQRAELRKDGFFVFIIARKNEGQLELRNKLYNLEKCQKDSCSYKINLMDDSISKI